jgi:hypothetical protein
MTEHLPPAQRRGAHDNRPAGHPAHGPGLQSGLIDEILEILQPQLDGQPVVDAAQYAEMLAAVAHYSELVRSG